MKYKNTNKILNLIIIILLIFIPISYYKKNNIKDNITTTKEEILSTLQIYFFDVGQADSILIKDDNNNILIDAGNNNDGKNLTEYLKNELNIEKINILIGTHPHEDHIGGLDDIINNFTIDKIYMPNITTTSKTFESVLDSIENKNYKITIPKTDELITLDNIKIKFLYTKTNKKDLNDSSLVIKIKYGTTSILLMGDASINIENKIIDKDIKSDIIKIGHHGSEYSTSKEFIEKVKPKYAIISVGKDNIYKHPSNITLNTLKENNIKVLRTDELGTIKMTIDDNNIKYENIKTYIDG